MVKACLSPPKEGASKHKASLAKMLKFFNAFKGEGF